MNEPRRFRSGDFEEIVSWYTARGHEPVDREALPQIGFVVPGLAAGFLFLTDSNIAFADLFISNSEASVLARARAVSSIVERLLEEGRACGFKYVAGVCSSAGTKKLCLKKGFTRTGSYEMLLKEV